MVFITSLSVFILFVFLFYMENYTILLLSINNNFELFKVF